MPNGGSTGKKQVLRFGAIGILNTLFDLSLFYLLTSVFSIHFIAANIASTSAALVLSFTLNAAYTFKGPTTTRTFVLFILVTIVSLWVLQPVVIGATEPILRTVFTSLDDSLALLAAKILATGASLVVNFFGYKYLVFRTSPKP